VPGPARTLDRSAGHGQRAVSGAAVGGMAVGAAAGAAVGAAAGSTVGSGVGGSGIGVGGIAVAVAVGGAGVKVGRSVLLGSRSPRAARSGAAGQDGGQDQQRNRDRGGCQRFFGCMVHVPCAELDPSGRGDGRVGAALYPRGRETPYSRPRALTVVSCLMRESNEHRHHTPIGRPAPR